MFEAAAVEIHARRTCCRKPRATARIPAFTPRRSCPAQRKRSDLAGVRQAFRAVAKERDARFAAWHKAAQARLKQHQFK
jgi:hypothetical protein